MAKKQKTYYVSRNDSWHTYEFLEKRKMNPKWQAAYFAAKEQRKKEMIISVLMLLILIVALATTFLVVNFYNGKTDTGGGIIETPSEYSIGESTASNSEITQGDSVATMDDYYYEQMKDAWQKAQDYVDSISDPEVKAAVQTPEGAVNGEYSQLLIEHPEDEYQINDAYQRIMRGE